MAETAAHLVEHVFPQVPVRQWVVTFPRRLRFFLHRDPALLGRVRRSVLRAIESGLRRRCPDAPRAARFGAVSFVQRFGSALNAHTHLHCCVTDGVFSLEPAGTLNFHTAADLDAAALSAVRRRIRSRGYPSRDQARVRDRAASHPDSMLLCGAVVRDCARQ